MADVSIIYNPKAGRGVAARSVAGLKRSLGNRAEFLATHAPGHAEELAALAARRGSRIVAAVGGDGTVHEVANGLLSLPPPGAILAVLPAGSANDYAFSLELPDRWWRRANSGVGERLVDVGLIEGAGRRRYFVNGLGIGFNGHVTREARRIRGLRGIPLYGLAVFRAMRRSYRHPELTIRMNGEAAQRVPTLALTLGVGKREGNFLLTPEAILDDGAFDYLHVGPLKRWSLIRYVPRMITGCIPRHDPVIATGRCRLMEVSADEGLMIHADGEFFCVPEQDVRAVSIELLPGRLRVLGKCAQATLTTM